MRANTALAVALVAMLLAIGLVAVDTVYSLEVRLESQQDGEWVTVAESPYRDAFGPPAYFGCAGRNLRLVVDNQRPWDANVRVTAWFYNQSAARDEFVVREQWSLASFSSREYAFTVPLAAFAETNETAEPKPAPRGSTDVQVVVGDLDPIYACINRGE